MNIIIRKETEKDFFETECMTKRAFWNLHVPGCNEHLLVHKLRKDSSYIPELSRVAEYEGKIIGTIMYAHATLLCEGESHFVLTFGPLCVEPEHQNSGVGGELLEYTMKLAREAGYNGIVIFGEPGYYPKHGFLSCDNFGITDMEGKNFDALMGIELKHGALSAIGGRFSEPEIYADLSEEELEEFDKSFPYMEKKHLPGMWV